MNYGCYNRKYIFAHVICCYFVAVEILLSEQKQALHFPYNYSWKMAFVFIPSWLLYFEKIFVFSLPFQFSYLFCFFLPFLVIILSFARK